jgi:hypothetical protein
MPTAHNGHHDGPAPRRLRFDDLASTLVRPPARPGPFVPSTRHSGRRLVLVAGCAFLLLWGALYLVFRDWRQRYRARAAYGATQVAPVIDALADAVPPGVNPDEWKGAVRDTHALLITVTGANLLDLKEMRSLRGELEQVVARARARPDSAREELAGVWDRIEDRAGFVLRDARSASGERHPRPGILPPPPKKEPGRLTGRSGPMSHG